jgi:hypothetical protein
MKNFSGLTAKWNLEVDVLSGPCIHELLKESLSADRIAFTQRRSFFGCTYEIMVSEENLQQLRASIEEIQVLRGSYAPF